MFFIHWSCGFPDNFIHVLWLLSDREVIVQLMEAGGKRDLMVGESGRCYDKQIFHLI